LQERASHLQQAIDEHIAHEVLDESTFANRWGFTKRQDYVVVSDVLGQSVVSIVFRKQNEQLGYGHSEYLINGPSFEHYANVTTYKPVYEVSRPIGQLTAGTPQELVRQLRTPTAVRHLVRSAKAKEDAAVIRGTVVAAQILHGLAPLATGIDEWRAGNRASAMLSFAGDAATILSFGSLGAAKYAEVAGTTYKATKWAGRVRVATTGLGLLEGTGRGIQGVKLLIDSNGQQGYGYIGEAFLRLLGVAADVKAAKLARRAENGSLIERQGRLTLDDGATLNAANRGLIPRQGRLTLEPGSTLNADELAVGNAFTRHGYDARGLQTASQRGIQGVRTADLEVSGLGRVDVFTPQKLNSKSISRAIEGKGTQSPVVAIRGNISERVMRETAARVWGKTSNRARAIQQVVFENNGVLTWFTRPK